MYFRMGNWYDDVFCQQGLMIRVREGGHMWYKPWESDVVVLATQAPAAAKLTAQILSSVSAEWDGGDGSGFASKILAAASAADRVKGAFILIPV